MDSDDSFSIEDDDIFSSNDFQFMDDITTDDDWNTNADEEYERLKNESLEGPSKVGDFIECFLQESLLKQQHRQENEDCDDDVIEEYEHINLPLGHVLAKNIPEQATEKMLKHHFDTLGFTISKVNLQRSEVRPS